MTVVRATVRTVKRKNRPAPNNLNPIMTVNITFRATNITFRATNIIFISRDLMIWFLV